MGTEGFKVTSDKKYQQLIKLQNVLFQRNIPFVSYRLPLQTEIITLVQQHSLPQELESLSCLDDKIGFIIAPFTESAAHNSFFLEPDCIFVSDNIDDIYIQKLSENKRFEGLTKETNKLSTTSYDEFTGNVNKALTCLLNKEFDKVVISKVRCEQLPKNFQTETFFLNLCDMYPNAMVYLLQLPGVSIWAGATPESLLEIENQTVKTVSLAGTQIASDKEIIFYDWSAKEIEEQGIVTQFIEDTLKNLGVSNFIKSGPSNYQAGNLIHLKTIFEFSRASLINKLGDFLKAFHPTPSVGGLPKAFARDFIMYNEQHDRSYYTGILGPINICEQTNIFVNLRCLQLFENEFVLYSGAGITSSSIAEKEWEETDNKMLTLLNVMKDIS